MATMTNPLCPTCKRPLTSEQINVAQGVAWCADCNTLSRLVDLLNLAEIDVQLDQVPSGCTIRDDGHEIHIRASTRSIGGALGCLAIALFWNGIVSVFVLVAIAGLWTNLVGPIPDYFPAPDMDGDPMSLGMTLFLCVFLTPFVVIGSGMIAMVFLSLLGRVDVRISGERGSVFTGVGFLGWTRRFTPSKVTRVDIGETAWKQNDQAKPIIKVEADDTVKFGSQLTEVRRNWLRSVLHVLLLTPDSAMAQQILDLARNGRDIADIRDIRGGSGLRTERLDRPVRRL